MYFFWFRFSAMGYSIVLLLAITVSATALVVFRPFDDGVTEIHSITKGFGEVYRFLHYDAFLRDKDCYSLPSHVNFGWVAYCSLIGCLREPFPCVSERVYGVRSTWRLRMQS